MGRHSEEPDYQSLVVRLVLLLLEVLGRLVERF
jgi:hypothetical protein